MNSDLILVTGATGNAGSVVLSLLEARGVRERAFVRRNPQHHTGRPATEAPDERQP